VAAATKHAPAAGAKRKPQRSTLSTHDAGAHTPADFEHFGAGVA
jgi:hypothetical protein